jgi:hypothetical protein
MGYGGADSTSSSMQEYEQHHYGSSGSNGGGAARNGSMYAASDSSPRSSYPAGSLYEDGLLEEEGEFANRRQYDVRSCVRAWCRFTQGPLLCKPVAAS